MGRAVVVCGALCVAALLVVAGRGMGQVAGNSITDVWSHAGETSAVVSCVTSQPSKVVVQAGSATAKDDDVPRYVHIVRIKGLEPGKEVKCVIAATGPDGKVVKSQEIMLKPAKIENAVRIPDDVQGPPYMLDKPNATYVLTKDIETPATAIVITASGVKLELDGHTVRYGKDLAAQDPKEIAGFLSSGNGIHFPKYGVKNAKLLNGVIEEATAKEEKNGSGYGHNPVSGNGVYGLEAAGLTMKYSGRDIRGFVLVNSGDANVHHNVTEDGGTQISNRHSGLDAFYGINKSKVHHNLIKRVRHRGISAASGSDISFNEIHLDSWDTNAYGVMCYHTDGVDVHHNFIFGGGYHVIGVGTVSRCSNCKVHDNLMQLAGEGPNTRSSEYGPMCGINGVRVTWTGTNLEYYNNVIDIRGKNGSHLRGTWFCSEPTVTGLVFRDNVVRVICEDDKTYGSAVCCCGDGKQPDHPVTLYRNNRLISNRCNIQFADSYGYGQNHRFEGCTFVREGNDAAYKTIRIGHGEGPTAGHVLADCKFEGGASPDSVLFEARGIRDFSVAWTVTIHAVDAAKKAVAGADVKIADKTGKEVFAGKTDEKGAAPAALSQYIHGPEGKTELTPHTVTVTRAGGQGVTATVTADAAKTVEVVLK